MSVFDDVLAANVEYGKAFSLQGMAGTAARGLAVVTCMDSRLSPLEMLGLKPGEAKILRNAGARVTPDVLNNLVLATHLLGVTRVMVIAHTQCKMAAATDEQVHETTLANGRDTRSLDFGTMSEQLRSLGRDVQRIRSLPYLPDGVSVIGCVYDVSTGLVKVEIE